MFLEITCLCIPHQGQIMVKTETVTRLTRLSLSLLEIFGNPESISCTSLKLLLSKFLPISSQSSFLACTNGLGPASPIHIVSGHILLFEVLFLLISITLSHLVLLPPFSHLRRMPLISLFTTCGTVSGSHMVFLPPRAPSLREPHPQAHRLC